MIEEVRRHLQGACAAWTQQQPCVRGETDRDVRWIAEGPIPDDPALECLTGYGWQAAAI